MAQTDLLSDTLTRIRNAQVAGHDSTVVLKSKLIGGVLSVLKKEGYIMDFNEFEEKKNIKKIRVDLKYNNKKPVISEISRTSKPGKRVYSKISKLTKVYGGLGIIIITTPQGIMTDAEAKEKNIGGEILCKVF